MVVDKFRGNNNPDIAVLNSNGNIVIFQNGITPGNPVTAGDFTPALVATVSGGTVASMTSGSVTGSPSGLPDLIVTRNDPARMIYSWCATCPVAPP